MPDRLTHDDFSPHVGETFTLTAPSGDSLELTLDSANLLPETNATRGGRAPFELIFMGTDDRYAPQATWSVAHPELGTNEIFLVPLGPEDGVMRYQAIFS